MAKYKPRLGEIWIDVPARAAKLAARGLEARDRAPRSKKCCTATGIRRANELIGREQQDAVLLRAWFRRHHGYYLSAKMHSGDDMDGASREPAIQAWWMWGGDPMWKAAEDAVDRASR